MSKLFILADILKFSKNLSWRRRMFSCVSSVLRRPERSSFEFKFDPSVLYFITFFQVVILVGETLSRKCCSKSWNIFAKKIAYIADTYKISKHYIGVIETVIWAVDGFHVGVLDLGWTDIRNNTRVSIFVYSVPIATSTITIFTNNSTTTSITTIPSPPLPAPSHHRHHNHVACVVTTGKCDRA